MRAAELAQDRASALGLVRDIPVLGIPVRFTTNSPVVADAVEESFAAWRALPPERVQDGTGAEVRIVVRADSRGDGAVVHRVLAGGRLLVRGRGCRGLTDPVRRVAGAHVSSGLVQNRANFRCGVLEALTFALLTRLDRQPLHAAGLVRNNAAVLLHGPSGAGKSTLALAAARAGVAVLSDSMVFVQGGERVRVWGLPSAVHLRTADARAPELPVRVRNGVAKVAVPVNVGRAWPLGPLTQCGICVLGERRRAPLLRPITATEAMARLDLRSESGFDLFADTIRPLLARIAPTGAWLLHPSADADASVPLLLAMLHGVSTAPIVPIPVPGW